MMIRFSHSKTVPALRIRAVFSAISLLALAACSEEFQFPFGTRDATGDGPAPIGATQLVERDVEAPEVFEVAEEGLWDGRPSLGGVWVAHPSADDPERVVIRNEENGRFVIGALFRRELENPGPELMVSSDAAAALNVLAGDPTMLTVTALRREEAEAPETEPLADAEPVAAVETPPAPPVAETAPAPSIAATPLPDPITVAAAAIEEPATEAEISAAEVMAALTQPATADTAEPAAGSSLERPFVQIGIFSVQENANDTAQALRVAGLEPTIFDQTSNGRQFWRVVVGPARTAEDQAQILEVARGLGFGDAFAVRN